MTHPLNLTINGEPIPAWSRTVPAHMLRDELQLTGPKGCDEGDCGPVPCS
jgi:aerobic-type carbon monoxide dehydrogenase small subunit (CoxS/CutS family)